MRSIPVTWLGAWTDGIRILTLRLDDRGDIKVSITDRNGVPYRIDDTGLNLPNPQTVDLQSKLIYDDADQVYLQVEAGSPGIGPTYKLYFAQKDGERLATADDSIEDIRIHPTIGVGFYDEWEDDLGVPWALPLVAYKKLKKGSL
jgi:hypothetical protein